MLRLSQDPPLQLHRQQQQQQQQQHDDDDSTSHMAAVVLKENLRLQRLVAPARSIILLLVALPAVQRCLFRFLLVFLLL
jgi:hypothetical protein